MSDDSDYIWDTEEYPVYFEGPCTCEHTREAHGWGLCEVAGCPCKAGWVE